MNHTVRFNGAFLVSVWVAQFIMFLLGLFGVVPWIFVGIPALALGALILSMFTVLYIIKVAQ